MKKKKPFVKKNAGNVLANIQFFNKSMGMGESMEDEKIILEYEDLPVEVNYGDIDDTTGIGREYEENEISFEFEVDKDRVIDKLWDFMQYDAAWGDVVEELNDSESIKRYIENNFDELFEYFEEDLKHHFREEAIEVAAGSYEVEDEDNGEYYYDDEEFLEDYKRPCGLRECIARLDINTDCRYDLLNLYDASLMENNTAGKKTLEKMICEGKSVRAIYKHLEKAFSSCGKLSESVMSDLDIEVQEAGGKDAWLRRADREIAHLESELNFLREKAPREMRIGGAFDDVEEIEDAMAATEAELEEWRNKKSVVSRG